VGGPRSLSAGCTKNKKCHHSFNLNEALALVGVVASEATCQWAPEAVSALQAPAHSTAVPWAARVCATVRPPWPQTIPWRATAFLAPMGMYVDARVQQPALLWRDWPRIIAYSICESLWPGYPTIPTYWVPWTF
jgi:hypothetical protein